MDQRQFEDKIRRKAQESNETFDMESMWSKVEPRILVKNSKKRRFIPLFFIGFGLLLAASFYYQNQDKTESISIKNNHELELGGGSQLDINLSTKKTNTFDQNSEKTSPSTDELPSGSMIDNPKKIRNLKNKNATKISSQNTVFADTKAGQVSIENQDMNVGDRSIKSALDVASSISDFTKMKNVSFIANLDEAIGSSFDRLPLLDIGALEFSIINILIPKLTLDIQRDQVNYHINKSWLSVGGGYYTNLRKLNNKGSSNMDVYERRKRTESPLDATSFYANYRQEFAEGWSWSTGLNYSSIWDVRVDSFHTDGVVSTDFQNYIINREVRRYLNYSSLGIPISIHYEIARQNWSILMSLGLESAILNTRKGLIWHDNAEYDISLDDQSIFKSRFNIRALSSIGVVYSITNKIGIQLQMQGQLPITNSYNNAYNISDKHYLLGGQIGLQYNLN